MINTLVTIIIVLALVWSAVRLFNTFRGVRLLRMSRLKTEVLKNMKGQDAIPDPQSGISIIVTGMPSMKRTEKLMGLGYDNYEIIILAEFGSGNSCSEAIKRYSMTKVSIPASAEFDCRTVRTLMRSRQRRYRKLVLADCRAQTAEALNCGMALCTHSRIMIIDSHTTPCRCALMRIDAEFESSGKGAVCAVSAPAVDPHAFGCDTAVEIVSGQYDHSITVIDRDYAISVGGFSGPAEHMQRMLSDLCDIPGLRHIRIRTPLATCTRSEGTFRVGSTRITSYLLLCVTAVATLLSIMSRRWDLIASLIMSLWMVYAVMVATGIICLAAVRKDTWPYPVSKTLLEPFVYPFYPQRGSILEKNFFKS